MKELKVDYISDIHADFWIKVGHQGLKLEHLVDIFIRKVLKPLDGDVLVIAGDTGHYFAMDTELLKQLKGFYKKIILVTGNHDRYLVSRSQSEKYNYSSQARVDEMKDWCNNNGIDYLDGNSIEINGFKIAGVGMWYDLPTEGYIQQWSEVMNDSNLITEGNTLRKMSYGYGATMKIGLWDTQAHYLSEVEKLKSLKDLDLLVTHIPPILIPDDLKGVYVGDHNNIFYESDNIENVKETGAEVVISGHVHTTYDFELDGVNLMINPLGYKGEKTGNSITQTTIYRED